MHTYKFIFFENTDQIKNVQGGLYYQITVQSANSPKTGLTVNNHWFCPGKNLALPVVEQSFKKTSDRAYESRSTFFPSWILLDFA